MSEAPKPAFTSPLVAKIAETLESQLADIIAEAYNQAFTGEDTIFGDCESVAEFCSLFDSWSLTLAHLVTEAVAYHVLVHLEDGDTEVDEIATKAFTDASFRSAKQRSEGFFATIARTLKAAPPEYQRKLHRALRQSDLPPGPAQMLKAILEVEVQIIEPPNGTIH